MIPLLLCLLMLELPDPASCVIPLAGVDDGILCTSGTGTGLWIEDHFGNTTHEISSLPGAGRNVVILNDGILFKECAADFQRVVLHCDGESLELYHNEYFSGPFPSRDGTFLVADPGTITEFSTGGTRLNSWSIHGFPASAARVNDILLYTGESGGLILKNTADGSAGEIEKYGEYIFRSLQTGDGEIILAEISPAGFLVLDPGGELLFRDDEGLFPSWTEDGGILCSKLRYRGLEPVFGSVVLLDPSTGESISLTEEGIPIHPVLLPDGSVVYSRTGEMPAFAGYIPPTDDPDGHIDVVYMHQRWDTPDWFNGSWSCGPTSCMMTVQYYRRLTPDSIWASYPGSGHWSPWGNYIPVEYTFLGYTYDDLGESPGGVFVPGAHGFICPDGGAWWNNMVDFLSQHQLYSAWAGTGWSTLTEEIDDLYPVVCSSSVLGSGHIILLVGYYSNHTIVVNDPYGDANESGWGSYYNGKNVLYDWPGYNNGHLEIGVSQLFYAQADVPSQADTLVDDNSTGFFKDGDCRYWHMTGTGFEGNGWWTYSTAAPPDTCIARWYPVLPAAGSYQVKVYIPGSHAEATGIYRINTTGGVQQVYLDQGLYSEEWVVLGTFDLNSEASLTLGDYTGTGGEHIAFDAAMFSPSQTGVSMTSPASLHAYVYPNPAADFINVAFPADAGGSSIQLYDTAGRLVLKDMVETGAGTVQLNTSALCTGVYVLRLMDDAGAQACSRLITVRR